VNSEVFGFEQGKLVTDWNKSKLFGEGWCSMSFKLDLKASISPRSWRHDSCAQL